jgi:hypothetical protein
MGSWGSQNSLNSLTCHPCPGSGPWTERIGKYCVSLRPVHYLLLIKPALSAAAIPHSNELERAITCRYVASSNRFSGHNDLSPIARHRDVHYCASRESSFDRSPTRDRRQLHAGDRELMIVSRLKHKLSGVPRMCLSPIVYISVLHRP